ncbi:hypothetical protein X777_11303 [Ooceraea biroi]|uniref:SWIM-type domain-containing protein n=1 Tax=Ooceraea biroi TaxID=2015173 RepID=A0A026W2I7_OOCBI|nr:hypothetical protein X777_11303 [Ooceraea biroi]
MNDLLRGLREFGHPELPSDSRTLVNTPNKINIQTLAGGTYAHYGLERALKEQLRYKNLLQCIADKEIPATFNININIDGLPLSKCSKSQLWLILGKIVGTQFIEPFVIGGFHGSRKPSSVSQFLQAFLTEYTKLNNEGFMYENRHYFVKLNAVLADTPARNFISCFPAHNSRCGKCIQCGETVNRRRIFKEKNVILKSNETFREGLPVAYQNIVFPFETIGVDMIKQFPLDYMHLLCLETMKKLILIWIRVMGKSVVALTKFAEINNFYQSFAKFIPAEFSRSPRSFQEIAQWKVTELRLLLLYLGPTCLRLNVLTQTSSHTCMICNQYANIQRLSVECRVNVFVTRNIYIPETSKCCRIHLDHNGLLLQYLLGGLSFTDEEFKSIAFISKDQFRELYTFCDPVPREGGHRHVSKRDLLLFLCKLRQGLSDEFLKVIFHYSSRQLISLTIKTVRTSLMQQFVPQNIGRHLVKPALIVAPDGYILTIQGPYFSDSKNNDAQMLRNEYAKFFAQTVIMPHVTNLGDFFRIAGAIINRYHPLIHMEGANFQLAQQLLTRSQEPNVVQARVEVENLHTKNARWIRLNHNQVNDFPHLDIDYLRDLTVGIYQVQLAAGYIQDRLQREDKEFYIDMLTNERGFLRVRQYSRFRNATTHQLWIAYNSLEALGDNNIDYDYILGYYCTCQSGARIVGCCVHVASVIWFLGYGRHQPNIRYPNASLLYSVLDAGQRPLQQNPNEPILINK